MKCGAQFIQIIVTRSMTTKGTRLLHNGNEMSWRSFDHVAEHHIGTDNNKGAQLPTNVKFVPISSLPDHFHFAHLFEQFNIWYLIQRNNR